MRISHLIFVLWRASTLVNAGHLQLDGRSDNTTSNSTTNITPTPSIQVENACASVGAAYSAQTGSANGTIEVPAQLAFDCLQSVPLDKANASRWVKSFREMLQFQSTIAFNKNPPSTYQMPAIDAAAVLDQIGEKINSGQYSGEYDFQLALFNLVVAVHDDHLDYTPDLVGNAFEFTRPIGLTSSSKDGISVPKLYAVELTTAPIIATNSSPVVAIDGQPAESFLKDLSQGQTGQDLDTNYNRLLVSLATFSAGNETGAFTKSKLFTGASTTLQFEDGSTKVYENKAIVRADFSTISSPQALYTQVCSKKQSDDELKIPEANKAKRSRRVFSANDKNDSSNEENGGNDDGGDGDGNDGNDKTSKSQTAAGTPGLIGYPDPLVQDSENTITGYHLSGNLSTTAVLAISSFGNGANFQQVVTNFLAKSSQAHKTHLLIDLQSNGGGDEDPEYDLFGQLFPGITLYEASAWRISPIFKAITQTMDELRQSSGANLTTANGNLLSITTPGHESFNFRNEISINSTNFDSFEQWYGPFEYNNDSFTSASQVNLSTPASGERQQGINEITGYGRRANASGPVFKPENIVILTNGDCSSMCASLIEQTRTIPGIKFVTVGGRPQYDEMGIAGGTHGGSLISLTDLAYTISNLTSILKASFPQKLQPFTATLKDWDTYALARSSGDPTINTRNTLRRNDTSGVPTQFLFDAADCRIFYTPKDLTNMVGLWARVAGVAFGPGVCSRTGRA